jgi:CO/xanthine dehydrogenase Mo-binding subunit
MAKACGTAQFGADIRMPGAMELAVVRSPYRHALIKGIHTEAAEAMPGVVGVDGNDGLIWPHRDALIWPHPPTRPLMT